MRDLEAVKDVHLQIFEELFLKSNVHLHKLNTRKRWLAFQLIVNILTVYGKVPVVGLKGSEYGHFLAAKERELFRYDSWTTKSI